MRTCLVGSEMCIRDRPQPEPEPEPSTLIYSVVGDMAYMTITPGTYTGSLTDAIVTYGYDANTQNLCIRGDNSATTTWVDFQFSYVTHGRPAKLHIQDITLSTDNIDGYAVYSRAVSYTHLTLPTTVFV